MSEQPLSMGRNRDMVKAQAWGFWIATKAAPRRAVRWERVQHEDGRNSMRGRNWVEVLEHGSTRTPERFHGADVEMVGPHEWLTYYPAVNEPVCGWGRPHLPDGGMQYCPRQRQEGQAFCKRHMTELNSSEGEEEHGERQGTEAGGQ